MKEKINCETARNLSVEKALEKLGHFPKRTTEKEAWFLSPFRSETQASFKVSKTKNRWYDHGEDNDLPGRTATKYLMDSNNKVIDKSATYKNYKDLNKYLCDGG